MSFNDQNLEKVRVLIVDDHTLFAEETEALLSQEDNLEIAELIQLI